MPLQMKLWSRHFPGSRAPSPRSITLAFQPSIDFYMSIFLILRRVYGPNTTEIPRMIQIHMYVAIDEGLGRNLYYYFVTSSNSPATDPLVLWMNGGPGCSSFDGFIYEHGPFSFEMNSTSGGLPILTVNPYSWTKVASIIYLESPAGVGFSYQNVTTDYSTDDLKTAKDVHSFLLKWFEEYPEYQSNSFYVSGESYAGVYVPTVTQEIVAGIQNGTTPIINLKGYLVGNGVTDEVFDGDALVPFAHGMGLISDQLFEELERDCNSSYWNATNSACVAKIGELNEDISALNIYNILEPCYHDVSIQDGIIKAHGLPESFGSLGETNRTLPTRRRMFGRAWPLMAPVRAGKIPSWSALGLLAVPCLDFSIANRWLNDPAVREAIHAQPVSVIGTWVVCADLSYDHNAGSMVPYHRGLLNGGYRALIYSGDHDMCVPFTGSQAWTRSMGYEVVKDWHPWLTDGQVAGYAIMYGRNLTFITIKGSGHTVPEYKPQEALTFLEKWLSGDTL
ncbi:hypothetical protein GOP47_0015545 [Adiantum capillus-veneris]|uniref:Carboxypeptidase n=1 Tax=Adiantum capillus-veneris TaxID=13818 RepID=A0A9D4UJW3_ADICA|nr:hypothetical protein GOP47_0015545 [Adiantum capillus-veneris]